MADPLVRIDRVTRRFRRGGRPLAAVDGISAEIFAGQVTGLVGPDGAGKSTLIRLIDGLVEPDEGRITVCGLDSVAETAAVHDRVAYMPQQFGLYEELTVAENLALHADLRGVAGAARREAFDRLLRFSGLASFRQRSAGALSGGMKQKLGLACALVRPPRLLLLDEPSVGVDAVSRRELWAMVDDLAEQGIGVLWSTAYLDEAERCATVLLMDRGRLLYAGPPERFTARLEGRSFRVTSVAGDRRRAQARAEALPGVVDAVIQGRNLRLVIAEDTAPPAVADMAAGPDAVLEAVAPRFEDAFVALLRSAGERAGARPPFVAPAPAGTGAPDRPAVEARALTRLFGRFRAVEDVGFAVPRGEIFGLLGPNGAGKSTTFKMLCGLLPPSSGTAEVAGVDLRRAPAEARQRLGYMSQRFSLYPDLSVVQNLGFFAGAYGLAGRPRRAAIERTLANFGLAPYAATNAGELPLGFKQRLALACAILHAPEILFLDEPTSGVDPLTRREFWSDINAMAAQGVTVMVTTHFLDEAEYCDRIGIIYRGRLVATDAPDRLKAALRSPELPEPSLEDVFVDLIRRADSERALEGTAA